MFPTSHVPDPRINVDKKGGEEQGQCHHASPKSGNALHREAVVPQSDPFHDCRQTDARGNLRSENQPKRTDSVEPPSPALDMWHPRAPTQGLVGVGRIKASQYRTMQPLGTSVSSSPSRPWFHACRLCGRCGRCSVVRIGLQCCGNARSVGASVGGCGRKSDRLMALRNGTKAVAPSAWRLCIQLVGAGKTTHRKRSWPIDKPGPPATTRRDRRRPRK